MTYPSVVLVEYDPQWPALFEAQKRKILDLLPDQVLVIEHIGSTAVPGLIAKPIIDLMAGLQDPVMGREACKERLRAIGYEYIPRPAFSARSLFRGGTWLLGPMYHLHLIEHKGADWKYYLRFRDLLRSDPEIARDYSKLKQELAARYTYNRGAYTASKTAFIQAAVARAEGL